jgi:hypothetical protein
MGSVLKSTDLKNFEPPRRKMFNQFVSFKQNQLHYITAQTVFGVMFDVKYNIMYWYPRQITIYVAWKDILPG